MTKCKNCGGELKIPQVALMNAETYGGHPVVAAECCGAGHFIIANTGFSYRLMTPEFYRKEDDWGNPIKKVRKGRHNCVQCGKRYDKKDLMRSLGEESMAVQTDHCSARCYAKAGKRTTDLIETPRSELIKRVEDLKELVERTKNQRDEYYDRMLKLEDRVVKYQKVRAKLNNYLNTEIGSFQGYGVHLSDKGKGIMQGLQDVKRNLINWGAEQCL